MPQFHLEPDEHPADLYCAAAGGGTSEPHDGRIAENASALHQDDARVMEHKKTIL